MFDAEYIIDQCSVVMWSVFLENARRISIPIQHSLVWKLMSFQRAFFHCFVPCIKNTNERFRKVSWRTMSRREGMNGSVVCTTKLLFLFTKPRTFTWKWNVAKMEILWSWIYITHLFVMTIMYSNTELFKILKLKMLETTIFECDGNKILTYSFPAFLNFSILNLNMKKN